MKKMILSLVTVMTVLGTSVSYGKTVNSNNGKNTVRVENVQKVDNKSDKHKGNTKQTQDKKTDKKDTTYRFGNERQTSNNGRTVKGVMK
jgi:uncharacterized protein YxeA